MRPLAPEDFNRIVTPGLDDSAVVLPRLGGGRAEVAVAHIRPVEANDPDIVNNGIALSGTAHWMFDRGLIDLSDDPNEWGKRCERRIPQIPRTKKGFRSIAWPLAECVPLLVRVSRNGTGGMTGRITRTRRAAAFT